MFKNVGLKYEPDIVTVALGYQDKERAWAPDKDHMSDSYTLSVVRGLLYKSNLFLVLRKNLLNLVKYKRNELDASRQVNRVSLEDFQENMSGIIELARAADCFVVFIEMPHNPYDKKNTSIHTPEFRKALMTTAKKHRGSGDVHYLDLFDFFLRDRPAADSRMKSREIFADDCHMRAEGHEAVAGHLADFFERNFLIQRARDR